MQTLVIGDLHGCFVEFQELLDQAGLAEGDAIVALGDVVDRGPGTAQLIDFLRNRPGAHSLMGNHERKHLRGALGEVQLARSQQIEKQRLGSAYPAVLEFLTTFPYYLELPEALLVHGYYEPGIPPDKQSEFVLSGTAKGQDHLESRYPRPWYEYYEADRPLIVGHQDYLENGQPLIYRERVFGLDTSCVHGGRLTGLLLPAFRFISVPSRQDYWSAALQEYRQQYIAQQKTAPQEAPVWSQEAVAALETIWAFALSQTALLQAEVQAQPGYPGLSQRQQTKLFADLAERRHSRHITGLFFLALRQKEYDQSALQRILHTPQMALELFSQIRE